VKWKADLITVIVKAKKKAVEKEKEMKEKEVRLDYERECHIEASLEVVKCKPCTLYVSPVAGACNKSGKIVFGPTSSVEIVEVRKIAQGSMAEQRKSSCGDQSVMILLPIINALSSNTTKGYQVNSKTSIVVTNTGCKVSLWGAPWTQDSTYSLKKKVIKGNVLSEVLQVTKSVQCNVVLKMNTLCGNGDAMAAPLTVNAITSNTATDLSSKPPSKTSTGVTYMGCKVSLWGKPWTQNSTYSLNKKAGKAKLLSEVCK